MYHSLQYIVTYYCSYAVNFAATINMQDNGVSHFNTDKKKGKIPFPGPNPNPNPNWALTVRLRGTAWTVAVYLAKRPGMASLN